MAHLHLGALYEELQETDSMSLAHEEYQQAIIVFPYSSKINLRVSKLIRESATSQEELNSIETHLRAAIEAADILIEAQKEQRLSMIGIGKSLESVDDGKWVFEPSCYEEIEAGKEASQFLLLFLCQEGRDNDAEPILKQLGYSWRLSPHALHYNPHPVRGPWKNDVDYVRVWDDALPPEMLAHLQSTFGINSVFWKEHHYSPLSPYFSYVHALSPSPGQQATYLDTIIHQLHALATELYPEAAKAKYAEWWAHCRPHSHGHQLHFDSDDEGRRREGGKPRHPIVSSVCYLTEGIGGPTLVTNQRLGDPLADKAWLAFPKLNRYTVFDGSVLHGVIPGRSFRTNPDERRITFMVAFWESVEVIPSKEEIPGSARPFPDLGRTKYTWPMLHQLKSKGKSAKPGHPEPKIAIPTPIESVWEQVSTRHSVPVKIVEEDFSEPNSYDDNESKDENGGRDSVSGVYQKVDAPLPRYNQCFQGF
ncbi:uncharacterized protein BJ171DRAFT_474981 [Polychytrium aggregatum]|uniref:uncharacterized protein n=1 Tax=Polychytrium aggregatum TaxID=110093 RepID=UPI0022FEC90C|nr:uncharacterized protein BJ171DRAFT_474981 [Polychytrium aggregatum]KAI9204353.1 hypothetical protein BJ171DRAFT_474981 [Polychytrium aggregatum]